MNNLSRTKETEPPSKQSYLVEIKRVSKIFKTDIFKKPFTAVRDLSLSFRPSMCTGLLGHNGAGKTTTIRMLLGLIFPDSGEILFQGKPLGIVEKKLIGYMPEVNKLPLNLTCNEILSLTLALREPLSEKIRPFSRKDLIEKKLKDLGLLAQKNKKVKNLSKGLARRLAFAQATIHEPTFLILDEPTSGLDPAATKLLERLILEEKAKGTTILLCTHELSHLTSLCDDVHILKKGQLVLTSHHVARDDKQTFADCLKPRAHLRVLVPPNKPFPTLDQAINMGLPGWSHLEELKHLNSSSHYKSGTIKEIEFSQASFGQTWLLKFLQEGYEILSYRVGVNLRDDEIMELYEKNI